MTSKVTAKDDEGLKPANVVPYEFWAYLIRNFSPILKRDDKRDDAGRRDESA